ncbi:hypothetical protein ABT095_14590 [Kitasatospora sp. NPDC002227]
MFAEAMQYFTPILLALLFTGAAAAYGALLSALIVHALGRGVAR